MFFFLSKTAGLLTQPIVIVAIVFLAAMLVRTPRRKKLLGWSAFILFMIFSNYFLAMTLMRAWEIPPIAFSAVRGPYDYAVVLTGITKGEAGPDDRVYFGRGADRAIHTLQLYKLGLAKKIVISGGSGKLDGGGILEADELSKFFLMAGVPEEDLLLENKSQNTHQSALEVEALLTKVGGPRRILLVTSGYHLRRAEGCFRKVGLAPDIFSTEPYVVPGDFAIANLIIPRSEALITWQVLFKEWTGMVVYWIMDYI